MSRFLSLDWDHGQVHLVSANVHKDGVEVLRARMWAEERIPNLAEAEEAGRWLRDHLKHAGIAPAPLLVCIGRDRLILRDVRYPPVPPHEEPAVVRFQVTKELHDSPDEVVIDYVPLGNGTGEQHAMALLLRQELLEAYRNLCKTAGLKLAVVAPRSFGSAAGLRHMIGRSLLTPPPEPPEAPVAALVIAQQWAEFCVLNGDVVVFARFLAAGDGLAADVQRNVRVLAGQMDQAPIRAIYVAGGNEHADLRHTLQDMLDLPVYPFDPLQGAENVEPPEGARGGFAGAAGLLYCEAQRHQHPINFVEPRQPRPPVNPRRKMILVGSLVASLVLLVGGFFAVAAIMDVQRKRQLMQQELTRLEQEEKELQPVGKNYDAVQDWLNTHVNCLDELYDTTAMDPDNKEIKITSWSCVPPRNIVGTRDRDKTKKDSDKDFVGTITVKGKAPKELTDKLRDLIKADSNYNLVQYDLPSAEKDFTLVIETKKRDLTAFHRKLQGIPPAQQKPKPGRVLGAGEEDQ